MYLKIEFKSYTRDSDTGCIVYITGSLVLSGETLFSDGFSSAPLVICRTFVMQLDSFVVDSFHLRIL